MTLPHSLKPSRTLVASADPKAGYLAHKTEIDRAIANVLESGRYVLGAEVAAFEREFAAFLSTGDGVAPSGDIRSTPRDGSHIVRAAADSDPLQAVGVASGTDALHLALRACGVGPGDAVVTVSLTSSATVAAIESTGAAPLLVDIDPATFTMDAAALEAAVESGPAAPFAHRCSRRPRKSGPRIKAVVPVHLYGRPADMPAICALAKRRGLRVLEDCAQSHGASVAGRMTGAWGDVAAFSFYPTKNLGALGDGGAVVARDPEIAARARLLREHGWRERQVSELSAMNSRLDEIQAAVLRVKLRHLREENARRAELAQIYDRALPPGAYLRKGSTPFPQVPLETPRVRPDVRHAYHQYVVRCGRRDELKEFLRENGVETGILYPVPIHLQPAYKGRVAIGPGGLRRTEQACRELLCLPMHPHLGDADVRRVAGLISRWHARPGTRGDGKHAAKVHG